MAQLGSRSRSVLACRTSRAGAGSAVAALRRVGALQGPRCSAGLPALGRDSQLRELEGSEPPCFRLCFSHMLCWPPLSGRHLPWLEKGSSPLAVLHKPTSALRRSIKGWWGFPRWRHHSSFWGWGCTSRLSTGQCLPSFTRALLPRMLHWCIDSWQLRVTVAQDQRVQRRLLDAMKEEGLKN